MGHVVCVEPVNYAATCAPSWPNELRTDGRPPGPRSHRFPSISDFRDRSHVHGRLDCSGQRSLLRQGNELGSSPHVLPLSWRRSSVQPSLWGRRHNGKLGPVGAQPFHSSCTRSPVIRKPTRSLEDLYLDVAAPYHLTRNQGQSAPHQVKPFGILELRWKCKKGPDHEWPDRVDRRTIQGCCWPHCAGKIVISVTDSLATLHPIIAAQLHASKNGPGMNAASVAGGINHQKVWWKCEKVWWKCDRGPDHEWVASIVSRTRQGGSGCPFCTCHQASVTNWLATLHPEIAAQLHPTLNTPGVDASKILPGSGMKYTWVCAENPGHIWVATPSNRTCPFCARQRPRKRKFLADFPNVAAQLHPTRNAPDVNVASITAGIGRKLWWKCDKGPDHEWEARVFHRTSNGSGCPFCAGRRPSVTNNLAVRNPEIAAQLHPTLNVPGVDASKILPGSGTKRYLWVCPENANHVWEATPKSRTGSKGTSCPDCARRRRRQPKPPA